MLWFTVCCYCSTPCGADRRQCYKIEKIKVPKQRAEKKMNLNATLEKHTGLKSQGETE